MDEFVRQHPPNRRNLIVMAYDMACALQHLHRYGVVHRDLAGINTVVNVLLLTQCAPPLQRAIC